MVSAKPENCQLVQENDCQPHQENSKKLSTEIRKRHMQMVVVNERDSLICGTANVHLTNINYAQYVLNYELLVILQAIYKKVIWHHLLQTEL